MKTEQLIAGLHPLERKVVPTLKSATTLAQVCELSKLKDVEAMRALQWLENKGALKIDTIITDTVELGPSGKQFVKSKVPERLILELLESNPKSQSELIKAGVNPHALNALIGTLKQNKWVDLSKEKELTLSITAEGKKAIKSKLQIEIFLEKLPTTQDNLSKDEQKFLKLLLRRKGLIKTHTTRLKNITLTKLGKELSKVDVSKLDVIDSLTPEMLRTGSWKGKSFRSFDVNINVPATHGGRRHFVNQAKQYAKKIWLEMGFQEMEGSIVNTGFWNFDALFTAQDHPVREMQDTFYLEDPVKGKVPNLKLIKEVQAMHEHGGKLGSKGWGSKWILSDAQKNVLRTHTTVLSVQTLAKLKESDFPAKFFAVGKCFRNEAVDWSHLFEFNQTEGIVVDPNANFRHLLGYLKQFLKKMGFPHARFRPAYFPYTEPSVEFDVYHPVHKKWLELGGAGMFRPEVVVPLLGKNVPVLAWGPGFDRIMLDYHKITDIRDLCRNDLEQLRTIKQWMQ